MPDTVTSVRELADEFVTTMCDQDPPVATFFGLDGAHDKLGDLSEEADRRFADRYADLARQAFEIYPATLTPADAITRAVVIQQADTRIRMTESRMVEYAITDFFVAPAAVLLTIMPMLAPATPELAEAYLGRLSEVPRFLRQAADRHRQGIAAGRTPVAHLVSAATKHIDRYLADPEHDPLAVAAPAAGPADFADRRDQLLADVVRPAFAAYRDTLTAEILPHGRPADRPGLSWLPGGELWYGNLVRAHTTTTRTPEELHRTGLDIIDALRDEYAELGGRVLGTTDQAEIFRRLKTDEELRWRTADELLDAARQAIARAEAAAPRWFNLRPERSCEVRPVPEAEAPGAAAAYYMAPSVDGRRPGVYFANTHQVTERFRHQSEATAFHEAVPGHHFQMSLSLGLDDLPMLRRIADVNAYGEGWGLYSERLADEMGLYSDDIAKLGMLTADSMRAGRLVVDTGMHAKGWSRQRAVDFLSEHTPMAAVEIDAETDRYIAYPGQALSYMVGRLEIQRIRAKAEAALGDAFDIRGFHDVVLGNGQLPMPVLADVVDTWVASHAAG
ncbi:MAG TPA: DUF885 domain-containing protein [Pseudonocardiaceae bacterium]|nr:DUF885 domain-containing protein [Pseudonocardiaceae bacterium]